MKKIFIIIFAMFFLTSCGYVPSARYAKTVLSDKIYIDVIMDRKDPQNIVLIKDALIAAMVDRFGSNVVSKSEADSTIIASLNSVVFLPVAYDKNGYVVSYRAVVTLKIDFELKNRQKDSLTTKGDYDFPIIADSVISDTKRFEAIKAASIDAIDEFIAVVSIRGLQNSVKN